jgi:alkylglycerol monooxygenase
MNPQYVAFIIPAFFLFVGIEYFIAIQKNKKDIFKFDSSVANISVGIAERLLNLFVSASFYGMFYYVYEHFALFRIPNTWPVWIILILATDFVWYWYHRLGHEINFLWGAHIVHHQSEEFNYTVSARVTTMQAFIRNTFWCALPFIGFHPTLIITISVLHAGYSFFTHTQLINKLGWLEYIFITPSHHRVHHGSNDKYLNKNYGDLFVFWDKLFSTFQKEEEKPVYGLTHPLKSYSFMWQHFHYYFEMIEALKRASGFKNKLKIIVGPPDVMDQNIRPLLERKFLPYKSYVVPTLRFKAYLILQLAVSLTLLFFVAYYFSQLNAIEKTASILLIILTLTNCGALLEQRKWNYHLEYIRLIILTAYLSYIVESPAFFLLSLFLIVLFASQESVKRSYYKFVYNSKEQVLENVE